MNSQNLSNVKKSVSETLSILSLNQSNDSFDLMKSTIKSVSKIGLKRIINSNRYVAKCVYHIRGNIKLGDHKFYPVRYRGKTFGLRVNNGTSAIFIDINCLDINGTSCYLSYASGEIILTVMGVCRYVLRLKSPSFHRVTV